LGEANIELKEGEEWWVTAPNHADELIARIARQYPNELTLIATGPLTNLALALQKDPAGMKKLKDVAIMGGAVRTKGNITPYAEFNIFSDPLAAKIVFESGLLITLVPLDVTHRVTLSPQWMEDKIKPLGNPLSKFVIEATGYDTMAEKFRNKQRIYLHDPLAVGVVINPDLAKKERVAIHVETEEGEHYGQTAEVEEGLKTDVCLGVDAERFLELFVSALG
jgi:purine nucleosidase